MSGPGPHTPGELISRVGFEAGVAALPGPTSSSRVLVGEAAEVGAGRAARSGVPERLALPSGSSSAVGKLDDLTPAPQPNSTGAWIMDSEGVAVAHTNMDHYSQILNDSSFFSGPRIADNSHGLVWTDPQGNTVRIMESTGSGRPYDIDRAVYNTSAGPRSQMDPATWAQAKLPKGFSPEKYGVSHKGYLNNVSHIPLYR